MADYKETILAEPDLEAYWRLGEASGTVAADETGNHDGSYVNAPTLGVRSLLARDADTAVTFDGVDQAVSVPYHVDLAPTAMVSLEALLKTTEVPTTNNAIASKTAGGGYGLDLMPDGTAEFFIYANAGYHSANSGIVVNNGLPHHIVGTYDGQYVRIYVDGVYAKVTDVGASYPITYNYANIFAIAANPDTTTGFDAPNFLPGTIDEVSVYSAALTPAQIREHFLAYTPKIYEEVLRALPGIQAYWRLGEVSGTVCADEIGGYDLTYVGGPTLGVPGLLADDQDKAVTFDGSTQYAELVVANWRSGDTGSGFVLAAFKTSYTGDNQHLFATNDTALNNGLQIYLNTSGQVVVVNLVNPTVNSINTKDGGFCDGEKHFLAVVSNGSAYTIYVDGISRALTVASGANNGNWVGDLADRDNLCIGTRDDPGGPLRFFNGTLDEVAYGNAALTANQVGMLYLLYQYGSYNEVVESGAYKSIVLATADLEGYWRLGETSGTTANDSSSGGNNGTLVNTPTLNVAALQVSEPSNKAMTFTSASSEYVTMGNVLDKEKTDAFSVEFLVKFASLPGAFQAIVGKRLASSTGWELQITTANQIQFLFQGTASDQSSSGGTPALTAGAVHHIVATNDGSGSHTGMKIYMDGILANSAGASALTTNITNAAALCLGARNTTAAYLNGTLDEVSIYGRELTATEVEQHYHAARNPGLFGTVNHWRMDEEAGATFVDSIGSNDLPIIGGVTLGEDSLVASDLTGKAALFDGSTGYAIDSTVNNFRGSDTSGAVVFFGKFSELAWGLALASCDESGVTNKRLLFTLASTPAIYVHDGTAENGVNTGEAYMDDELPHHVIISSSGTAWTIFVDGVEKGLTVSNGTNNGNWFGDVNGTTNLSLAGRIWGGFSTARLNGHLDSVAVLSAPVTPEQAYALYLRSLAIIVEHQLSILDFSFGADTMSTIYQIYGISADSAVAADALTPGMVWPVAEAMLATDTLTPQMILNFLLAESGSVADRIAWATSILLEESVLSTDDLSALIDRFLVLSDALSASDTISPQFNYTISLAEGALLLDLTQIANYMGVSETVAAVDAAAGMIRFLVSAVDTAAAADSSNYYVTLLLSAADDAAAADVLTPQMVFNLAVADTATFVTRLPLVDGEYSAWILNTETAGAWEYSNYPFNSFATFEGRSFGLTDTTLYELEGSDDDGTEIAAWYRTGLMDLGTSRLKTVPRAYLGYSAESGLVLKTYTTEGGEKRERWYAMVPTTADATREGRVKLARGVRARLWGFEVHNVDGGSIDVDKLQVLPVVLRRRI